MTTTSGTGQRIQAAQAALAAAVGADPGDVVTRLSEARALLDEALDAAMAEALLGGASVRSVAEDAGLSPNAVPPRLARTQALSPYASAEGRVTAEGVARARYDRERGTEPPPAPAVEPLRFRRRQR
jgi:hypothetical protein